MQLALIELRQMRQQLRHQQIAARNQRRQRTQQIVITQPPQSITLIHAQVHITRNFELANHAPQPF